MTGKKRQFPSETTKTENPKKYALGIFPIITKYEEYRVSDANRAKITTNVLKFLMGNEVSFEKHRKQEAMDYLFQRDHDKLLDLLNGKIKVGEFGLYLMPPVFFSKMPTVICHTDYPMRLTRAAAKKQKVKKNYIADGTFYGDIAEMKVFKLLKSYLESTKDDCLVLHGHSFLYGNNYKEKDFIVLNLSKGYIMVIEVKASSKYFGKAKAQLQDSMERVQAVFNSVENMSQSWKFIGICYIEKPDINIHNNFTIFGTQDFHAKIATIEMKAFNQFWNPKNHFQEFVCLAKQLLYEAQGHPQPAISKKAIVEKISDHIEKASTPENILFWTPEQLSILEAMNEPWMCLMGYYGVGKTILLIERAEQLSKNENNIIHFFVDGGVKQLKTNLENRFAQYENVKVKMLPSTEDFLQLMLETGQNSAKHHVLIDEVVVSSDDFVDSLQQMKAKFASVWLAIGLSLVRFQEVRACFERNNFLCPMFYYSLRNGSDIANYSFSKKVSQHMGLSGLENDITVNSHDVNSGLLHIVEDLSENQEEALTKAFTKVPIQKKIFILMEEKGDISISSIQTLFPNYKFTDFHNEACRKLWFATENCMSHLLLIHQSNINKLISGLEFETMIYVCQICKRCGQEENSGLAVTRAKSCLIVSKYQVNQCKFCQMPKFLKNNPMTTTFKGFK